MRQKANEPTLNVENEIIKKTHPLGGEAGPFKHAKLLCKRPKKQTPTTAKKPSTLPQRPPPKSSPRITPQTFKTENIRVKNFPIPTNLE